MSRRPQHPRHTAKSRLRVSPAAAVRVSEVRPRAGPPRLGPGEGQGDEEVPYVHDRRPDCQALHGNRASILR